MKKFLSQIVLVALFSPALATVTMDWVNIGNPGNAADPLTGYGAVGYEYKIGKYEVTIGQYVEFLNAKATNDPYSLYNTKMSGYGIARNETFGEYSYTVTGANSNLPVSLVSWFDAARFANWMLNGQRNGDTETGAYTLNGVMNGVVLANTGAGIRLPTESEWYKAGYYDPTRNGDGGYWLYPTQGNTVTTSEANYSAVGYVGPLGDLSGIGTFSADSYYGTFDQGGNVWEWNDAIIDSRRGLRGGSCGYGESNISSLIRDVGGTSGEDNDGQLGFRIVSISAIPEPSSLLLMLLATGSILTRRRR
jgi:sulfatase modifying factor 1